MTRTILLIEDNAQNRYLAAFLLEKHGFAVVPAVDGRSAIDIAGGLSPAAILLDIQLPGMDGYAVARALRSDPRLYSVPMIAVTSHAMVGDRDKAIAAGCDGYIEKPIDPETFVAQIESVLSSRQQGRT